MDVNSLRRILFFTTVHIRAGNATGSWTGTGFFFGTTHVQLVTNKHVLEGAEWIEFTALRRTPDGTRPQLGQGMKLHLDGPGISTWIGHPNDEVDVALFPAAQLFELWDRMSGQQPYYRAVTPDTFADLDSLDAIEDVIFVGYPNGLFDRANLTPIARHGQTATPPNIDYQGKPTLLIDAPVFGGSSGSPVFIVRDALSPTLSGDTVIDTPRILFLGVVASVAVRSKTLEVLEPAQQKLIGTTVLQQELGLGVVYKASTITDILDEIARLGRA